ncbi:MAG TPA: hypothetical protein VME92_14080 [Acetobacteraceae bacterium]|nr:hypothetical protein [Acetobacteraceae bacterium]
MGRIWTEVGAIRAITSRGFLNCFSSPTGRYFVVSSQPLSEKGSRVRYAVAYKLMVDRRLELVSGNSFCAAYRLRKARAVPVGRSGLHPQPRRPATTALASAREAPLVPAGAEDMP